MSHVGLLIALVALALASPASAHPGRLAADGCHDVHTRFVHQSGKVDEPGTRHCHRKLGEGMALDGQEQLLDVPRTEQGVPLDLDPTHPFTVAEFNALVTATRCGALVPAKGPGDALNSEEVAALRACAARAPLAAPTRQSLDRLRWILGERW